MNNFLDKVTTVVLEYTCVIILVLVATVVVGALFIFYKITLMFLIPIIILSAIYQGLLKYNQWR